MSTCTLGAFSRYCDGISRLGRSLFAVLAAATWLCALGNAGFAQDEADHVLVQSGSVGEFLAKHPSLIVRLRCSSLGGNTQLLVKPFLAEGTNQQICGFVGLVSDPSSSDGFERVMYYFGPTSGSGSNMKLYVDQFVSGLKGFRDSNHFVRSSLSSVDDLLSINGVLRKPANSNEELHPYLDYGASIDDDNALYMSYGTTLFDLDGTTITIPDLYQKVNYLAAGNLDEYNQGSGGGEQGACGDGKQFAILIHEPHSKQDEESMLFSFLDYLHSEYPKVFNHLYVLQEGQYAYDAVNENTITTIVGRDKTDVGKLILESEKEWKGDTYTPLNSVNIKTPAVGVQNAFGNFLKKNSISAGTEVAEQSLEKQLKFYGRMTSTGGLDPVGALLAIDPPSDLKEKLEHLEPHNVELVTSLLNSPEIGFRGALAFKLYAEGNRAGNVENAKIKVFGLEDLGLYLASCALNPECVLAGKTVDKPDEADKFTALEPRWKAIQPYRDAVMASHVLVLLGQVKEPITPIVLASVATHLPIIRKALCDAGITSVMLAPGTEGLNALPTTPFSPFLYNGQSAFSNMNQFARAKIPSAASLEEFYSNATTFGYSQ
jgi:hypothetical protein